MSDARRLKVRMASGGDPPVVNFDSRQTIEFADPRDATDFVIGPAHCGQCFALLDECTCPMRAAHDAPPTSFATITGVDREAGVITLGPPETIAYGAFTPDYRGKAIIRLSRGRLRRRRR